MRLARLALALAVVALLASFTTASAGAAGLTSGQRHRVDALISEFENSTQTIQYCYIEALDDGRGYTAGRAGFTSATGDLLEVAESYTQALPDNPLAPFLPRLRELADAGDGSLEGLEGLPDAWAQACGDARLRTVQDEVVDREYYRPAVREWRARGLHRPLSLAAIYDAEIQHGGGPDHDGVPAMLRRAAGRAGGSPRGGRVSEGRFLLAFLKVRRATLAHAHDPSTRTAWAETVPRANAWLQLLRTRQWQLRSPIRVRTRNYDLTIK